MMEGIEQLFKEVAPAVDFCSLRVVQERSERIHVRQDILQPVSTVHDTGGMITILHEGGMGYAGTSDLSASGLKQAVDHALTWAERSRGRSVVDYKKVAVEAPKGEYKTPVTKPWDSMPLSEKIQMLQSDCAKLKVDERIVDWGAVLWYSASDQLYLTSDGGRVFQQFSFLLPGLSVTANEGSETISRNFGGDMGMGGQQGGLEVLDRIGYADKGPQLSEEVLTLLKAPNCPTGTMDLLLDSDQMVLQIHESIGHPLELDRILGDERNYAGTTFVTMDMLGSYQYGSELLNITFDPTRTDEFASYAFDDDGVKAEKQHIIKDGILQRALGGVTSQARADKPGVANSRACAWNRQPIDRMANLNLEPGDASFEDMVSSIELGVFMKQNNCWSIDDSRNKFQFGCEYGRMIRNGELKEVVKKPNYKGISATFWRNLKRVGNPDSLRVFGTPYCGKGEPNQAIRVGHASPICLFSQVDVFGGE